jgi:hypothetical protein
MDQKLIITPKTKVLELIGAYPQLEDVLISYVPVFSKLKNPVLRKTVARIATLQQAAAVGNVKVEDLINRLRKEVGQDIYTDGAGTIYNTTKPSWYKDSTSFKELDVRQMLANGEQPVAQVIEDLKGMGAGSIFKLIAPFLPAPLIDKATSLGFKHWLLKENDEHFIVYFFKD